MYDGDSERKIRRNLVVGASIFAFGFCCLAVVLDKYLLQPALDAFDAGEPWAQNCVILSLVALIAIMGGAWIANLRRRGDGR